MKGFIGTQLIVAFMIFFAAASAYAAPVITSATINYNTNPCQITVNGTELVYGKAVPKVVFDGASYLAIVGTPTKAVITAQLPTSIAPGTYKLKVVNGNGTSAYFYVSFGAVGLQGAPGAAGPRVFKGRRCPQGETGATGPQGPQGVAVQGRYRGIFKCGGRVVIRAKGDGVTDDLTALNAAIVASNALGQELFLPPGPIN